MPKRIKIFRGDRLKAVRGDISQEMLASAINIDQAQLARYETGAREPSPAAIGKLAEYLGVTSDYLLGLVDKPQDRLAESQLTEEEWALLNAFRRGDVKGLLRIAVKEDHRVE